MVEQAASVEQALLEWNNVLVELANKSGTVATDNLPQATELALNAVRVVSVGELIIAVPFVAALVGFVWWGFTFYKRDDMDYEIKAPVILFTSALPSVFLGIVSSIILLDVWSWAGIFWPELRVAYEIIHKVL